MESVLWVGVSQSSLSSGSLEWHARRTSPPRVRFAAHGNISSPGISTSSSTFPVATLTRRRLHRSGDVTSSAPCDPFLPGSKMADSGPSVISLATVRSYPSSGGLGSPQEGVGGWISNRTAPPALYCATHRPSPLTHRAVGHGSCDASFFASLLGISYSSGACSSTHPTDIVSCSLTGALRMLTSLLYSPPSAVTTHREYSTPAHAPRHRLHTCDAPARAASLAVSQESANFSTSAGSASQPCTPVPSSAPSALLLFPFAC
mmetsp:Transcript_25336/g.86768  ORF Transcript_25336/g.86768 Transcript_25336/m.86768 type:complete len:261 (-) Transcript_25336:510-1292(-)